MQTPRIAVVGSANIDLVTFTDKFPKPGQTIFGDRFDLGFGGKGANQAVAARLCGAQVDMVAKVGDDLFITGQPTEAGLREMQKRGVTTVVNLRTPPELARIGFDEPALIQQLEMTYVYLPVRGDTTYPYSPATVKAFGDVPISSTS